MAIPTTIESLSTTAASNGPSGSDDRNTADDGLRQAYAFIKQTVSLGSNITSASTITPPSTGSVFNVTGTTAITTIASTNSWDGRIVTFIFAGSLTLTHSSNLALPGSANITTAANDIATFVQTASGAWRLTSYRVASDNLTVNGALSVKGNTTLGDAGTDTVTTNGNVTINAPSSGTALTATGLTANATLALIGGGPGGSGLYYGYNFTMAGGQENLYASGTNGLAFGTSGNAGLGIYTNAVLRQNISATGNVTINAPSSGSVLTLAGAANAIQVGINSGNTSIHTAADVDVNRTSAGTGVGQGPSFQVRIVGGNSGLIQQSTSTFGLWTYNSGPGWLNPISIANATGAVTINAPSSGYGLNIPTGTPASAGAAGTAGDIAWDSSYIYVCTATNTWKRAALSTW